MAESNPSNVNKIYLYKRLSKGLKVCKHCGSVHINFQKFCSKCHTQDFIEDTESVYKTLMKLSYFNKDIE